MTNYSKLSDTEIAERVCQKLGWGKPDSGKDITVWLIEILDLPDICRSTFIYNWERPKDHVCAEIACFGWAAPIMMQKVEEWLIKRYIEPSLTYCNIDHIWYSYLDCTQFDFLLGEISVESERKTRALYEAFLQVEVTHD